MASTDDPGGAAAAADARVHAQYEAFPYPARDPRDEAKRLVTGSPSRLAELTHFVFAGRRPKNRPLRVLVAGGGTGDGLVMLAQHLADDRAAGGAGGTITYLDLSTAAREIAEARIAARGLTGDVTFVTGSLMEAEALAPGPFDYIDCCGVLHHLADPAAGLAGLAALLAPGGGLGLMVYGTLGRTGVYPLQSALRRLTGEMAPKDRVAVARRLVERLPETNWFRRNPFLGDHKASDSGLYDLLLHNRDRAYTVPEILDWTAGAGLAVTGFQPPLAYDPRALIDDAELTRRIEPLPQAERWALAEELSGAQATHAFYAVPAAEAEARVARLPGPEADATGVVPVVVEIDGPALARRLGRQPLPATVGGRRLSLPLPPLAAPMLARIDGRTDLPGLYRVLKADRSDLGEAKFRREFDHLWRVFHGLGRMFLEIRP